MENATIQAQNAIDDIFAKKEKRARMRREGTTIGIIVVLILVVFFQSIELGRLRGYVQAAGNSVAASAAQQPAVPAAAPRPNAGLPAQVGGC